MADCPYCDTETETEDNLTAHLENAHSREELSRVDRKRVEKHAAESGARSRLGRVAPDGRLSRRAALVGAGTVLAGLGVGIGGRMAQSSPTQIQDWTDLNKIRNNPSDNYVLANDLDKGTSGYGGIGDDFDPIGDSTTPFDGSFDGQGNTISGLTINRGSKDEVALFGRSEGGTFTRTSLNDVDVTGDGSVGSLVGRLDEDGSNNGGVVSECSVSGSVTGNGDNVGGLVGRHQDGLIELSSSTATVSVSASSFGRVGGLVGENRNGVVKDSYATGDVSGDATEAGGLIGAADDNVTRSYATGNVSGGGQVGGLIGGIGFNLTVDKSYATGDVSGTEDAVGGFAGGNNGTITDSYAIGDVTGQKNRVGGCVGESKGTTRRVYAAGSVSGSSEVGGLIGRNENFGSGTLEDSYWDTTTTGQGSAVGFSGIENNNTGLTTSQMQGTDAQTNMSALSFSSPDIWTAVVAGQQINPVPDSDGYPILTALDAGQQLSAQGLFPPIVEVDGADNTTLDNVTVANDN